MNLAALLCSLMVLIIFHDEIPFFKMDEMKRFVVTTRTDKKKINYVGLLTYMNSVLLLSGLYMNHFNVLILFKDSIHSFWGNFLMLVGIFIIITASKTVAEFIAMNAKPAEPKLIDLGIYSKLRHPRYLGETLFWIGAGISSNNMIILTLISLLTLVVYLFTMNRDEKILIEDLGDSYVSYMKKTKRVIPMIY
jgi:protein-S-isoprenylcysteine O-methyltransferase Ste14